MESHKKISHLYKRNKHFFFISIAIVLAILVATYMLYFVNNLDRVPIRTYFDITNLGGMTREEARRVVDQRIVDFQAKPLSIVYGDQHFDYNLTDLGVNMDSTITTDSIFGDKENSFPADYLNYFNKKQIKVAYTVDCEKFANKINADFGSLETFPVNSNISGSSSTVQVSPAKIGNVIDRTKLAFLINQRVEKLSHEPVELSFIFTKPLVDDEGAIEAKNRATDLSELQIQLAFGYDKWVLTNKKLLSLIRFYPEGLIGESLIDLNVGNSYVVRDAGFNTGTSKKLDATLDNQALTEYLSEVEGVVNKKARDATLRFENGKVVEFSSAQNGQELNTEETHKRLVDVISNYKEGSGNLITVELPVKVTKAKIANQEINSLGIKELIGSGVSYFAGSIPNRVHNVELGSKLINGTIVAPGETFSFVSLVGPVSAAQGFKSAYVIKSGRTVLDDGGGICQVSTTVFRAALNSGLPILKRTSHAYRVSYYEQRGFKAGLDATIFSPNVDLQFKNDTAKHILVQTTFDRANYRLQVDIYGTGDGRRVELSEPVVSNIKPAPEPKYEDDPTLPKGVVKQVDYAAAGATSVFTRKVYKGNELIIDESFKSVFRPWQAVFLVGTAG